MRRKENSSDFLGKLNLNRKLTKEDEQFFEIVAKMIEEKI